MSRALSNEEKDLLGLLEKLFTTSQEAVCVVQGEAFIYVNHMFLILFGFHSRREFSEVKLEDIFSDKLLGSAGKKIRAILAGDASPFQEEISLLKTNGSIESLKCTVSEISFRDSSAYVVRMQDVTEYRSKIENLQETEEIFKFLKDRGGVGFYLTKRGKIVFASQELPKILGITKEEFFSLPGNKKNKFFCYLPGILHSARGSNSSGLHLPEGACEYKITTNPGTSAWLLFQVKKIDFHGIPGALVVVQDITEKKLEVETKWFKTTSLPEKRKGYSLQDPDLVLAGKTASLGRLTEGVIHDLNNCLTGITGFASLAKSEIAVGSPIYEYLHIMEKTALRTKGFMKQLLRYASDSDSEAAIIDLNRVIAGIVAIVSRTFDRAIQVELKPDHDLLPIKGIWSRLEYVLMTLCLNVRDAMPDGGVLTVSTGNVEFKHQHNPGRSTISSGHYALVTLTATKSAAKNIPEKPASVSLFTAGQQERFSAMGLSMVSVIISDHDGYIDVETGADNGLVYSLYFPVYRDKGTTRGDRTLSGDRSKSKGVVLLVDDEKDMRSLGRAMLANLGFQAILAEDGEKACALYREKKEEIDLIILDIIMPGMGGEETLKCFQEIKPGTRVVITSGVALSKAKEKLLNLGARAFLQKPFLLRDLKEVIQDSFKKPDQVPG